MKYYYFNISIVNNHFFSTKSQKPGALYFKIQTATSQWLNSHTWLWLPYWMVQIWDRKFIGFKKTCDIVFKN